MNKEQGMVKEFHQLIGAPAPSRPEEPSPERRKLRVALILEELQEFAEASNFELRLVENWGLDIELKNVDSYRGHPDLVAIADALGDLLVVVYGAGLEWGIDLEPVFREIHRSNMTKGGGPVRADGKALKGPNYSAPDLGPIIERQIAGEPEPVQVTTHKSVAWLPFREEDVVYRLEPPTSFIAQRDPGDETTHRVVPLDLAP